MPFITVRDLRMYYGKILGERRKSPPVPLITSKRGPFDAIVTPAKPEAMQKQIPGAQLELFEGGHLFFIQDPRAFERIAAFLKGDLNG